MKKTKYFLFAGYPYRLTRVEVFEVVQRHLQLVGVASNTCDKHLRDVSNAICCERLKRLSIYVNNSDLAPLRTRTTGSPTTRQKILRPDKMAASLIPDIHRNKCWFCRETNMSTAKVRDNVECGAQITPTHGVNPITYRIYSFGSRPMDFSCCEKLHASILQQAIEILQGGTLVAVRVGVAPRYAILIKDANGTVRFSTTETPPPSPGPSTTRFWNDSRAILHTNPAPNTGKIENIIAHVIVLIPLTRLYIPNSLSFVVELHSQRFAFSQHKVTCFLAYDLLHE